MHFISSLELSTKLTAWKKKILACMVSSECFVGGRQTCSGPEDFTRCKHLSTIRIWNRRDYKTKTNQMRKNKPLSEWGGWWATIPVHVWGGWCVELTGIFAHVSDFKQSGSTAGHHGPVFGSSGLASSSQIVSIRVGAWHLENAYRHKIKLCMSGWMWLVFSTQ